MDQNKPLEVKHLDGTDRSWVRDFITRHWGSPEIVVHGAVYLPEFMAGCKALLENQVTGLVTWLISGPTVKSSR